MLVFGVQSLRIGPLKVKRALVVLDEVHAGALHSKVEYNLFDLHVDDFPEFVIALKIVKRPPQALSLLFIDDLLYLVDTRQHDLRLSVTSLARHL